MTKISKQYSFLLEVHSVLVTVIFVDLNIYYEAGFSEAVTMSLRKIQERCMVHYGGFLVHEMYLM